MPKVTVQPDDARPETKAVDEVLVAFSVILPDGSARTILAKDEADKDRRVAKILQAEFPPT
jgi:hypothetical protein